MRRAGKLAGCAIAFASWAFVAACGGDDGGSKADDGAKGDHADAGGTAGHSDAGTSGGSADKSDTKLAADAKSKLMECKLYDPKGSASDTTIQDDADRCEAKCVVAASCSDLRDLRCSDTPSAKSPVVTCIFACTQAPADGYACKDGTKIAHIAVCDGSEDCDTGEDEEGCKAYTCKNGETLEINDVECDGFEDCTDGSDEADCTNVCG